MIYKGTDILQVALKIELNGEQFYRKAAQSTTDKNVKELFGELAEEEAKHAD